MLATLYVPKTDPNYYGTMVDGAGFMDKLAEVMSASDMVRACRHHELCLQPKFLRDLEAFIAESRTASAITVLKGAARLSRMHTRSSYSRIDLPEPKQK